ncbi:glucose-1-phosphatase [Klebsiella pneumoniae]|uniref:Glucose-1-phosphatase n=1 Tax=Klebsiella pneumoniae TaxID=573 RepID=A0A2X1QR35_KLEPN|nr:glucose-1-phosphatase [Klebsiella pneumoniae]
MKKRLLAAAVAGAVMLSAGAQAQDTAAPEGYQLQQVLIMSRHNLRAPLANNGSVLEQSTAKAWPQWDVPGGQLTTKGGVLEVYMGHYMREWLAQQKLVTSGECPPENAVYAYANSLQRTVATAQFFITGAFPGCGIPVHHQPQMGTMDPTFNPVITDDSPAFREKALAGDGKRAPGNAVDRELQAAGDDDRLPQLALLQREELCSLSEGKDTFSAGYQQEPECPDR